MIKRPAVSASECGILPHLWHCEFFEAGLCPSPAHPFGTEESLTSVKGNGEAERLLATGAHSAFSPPEQRQTLNLLESEKLPSLLQALLPLLATLLPPPRGLGRVSPVFPTTEDTQDDLLKVTN